LNNNNAANARVVESLIAKYGCLPSIGDRSEIARFSAGELAEAIFTEVKRGEEYGFAKITLHMDIPDAVALAKFLKAKAD
jgi:hypothetical protein